MMKDVEFGLTEALYYIRFKGMATGGCSRMPNVNEADSFTLWNLPKEKRQDALRQSGLESPVAERIRTTDSSFQPDDISDRLKPFRSTVDEASFFGSK